MFFDGLILGGSPPGGGPVPGWGGGGRTPPPGVLKRSLPAGQDVGAGAVVAGEGPAIAEGSAGDQAGGGGDGSNPQLLTVRLCTTTTPSKCVHYR